jgi:hypothetical protein
MKRTLALVAVLLSVPHHAAAQLIVIDIPQINEMVTVVEKTIEIYSVLMRQYNTIVALNTKLEGGLARFRTPSILPSRHDIDRYGPGRPYLQGLNDGDARGDLYRQVVSEIPDIRAVLADSPPDAADLLRRQVADLEIGDSIAQRGIDQRATVMGFTGGELLTALEALADDTVDPRTAKHFPTARLDLLTGYALTEARQRTAQNQLLSHALEQLLLRGKQTRDTEAIVMKARVNGMVHGFDAVVAAVEGSDDAIVGGRRP